LNLKELSTILPISQFVYLGIIFFNSHNFANRILLITAILYKRSNNSIIKEWFINPLFNSLSSNHNINQVLKDWMLISQLAHSFIFFICLFFLLIDEGSIFLISIEISILSITFILPWLLGKIFWITTVDFLSILVI
jgi:hypothetical protein